VIGALAFGVPQLLLPMGADQPLNADRCRRLGVAAVLDAQTATERTINGAARTVLDGDGYRVSASRLRDEIRSLPRARQAARRLERLAETAQS
jgi:UDP:flavonoid glycosyltransferase YjiC (YdhE family)